MAAVFASFQARTGAHAEGVVDDQQHQSVAGERGGVAVDEGIREGENQEQQHQQAQREEQEMIEPAMTRGGMRAGLVEHQGADGLGGLFVALQEMQIERQREAGQRRRGTRARRGPRDPR